MVVSTLSRISIMLSWGRGVGHGTIATDSFCYHGDLVDFMNKCVSITLLYAMTELRSRERADYMRETVMITWTVTSVCYPSTHTHMLERNKISLKMSPGNMNVP